jgi:general secretion pathway protein E
MTYQHIDPLRVNVAAVTAVMNVSFAQKHQILAVEVEAHKVRIATAEPGLKGQWYEDIAGILGKEIELVFANPDDIARYIREFYSLSAFVKSASGQTVLDINTDDLENLVSNKELEELDLNDRAIVRIVDWLWQYAFNQRASDIHLEPRREQGIVRFRIDGVLHQVYQMPRSVMQAMMARLKLISKLDVLEKRKPQDGRIKTNNLNGQEIEMRVATMPVAFGEKMVMRIFDPDILGRELVDIGFDAEDLGRWQSLVSQTHGLVLVTGPTGSGKTTTLYATLQKLSTTEVNVCTIEDPIELIDPSFNQMQVNPQHGVDFAQGVRTLMRQDPDIIMVGEVRDLATADMAIQAALTGHLVLSTLHTNDAPSAVIRLLELGVASYLIEQTLLGVLAQRLLRTLCEACKRAVAVEDKDWQQLDGLPQPKQVYEAVGCLECRMTGYKGRMGIYELMLNTPALKHTLRRDADGSELHQQAINDGMRTLRVSAAHKVVQGLTSLAEMERVTPPTYRH